MLEKGVGSVLPVTYSHLTDTTCPESADHSYIQVCMTGAVWLYENNECMMLYGLIQQTLLYDYLAYSNGTCGRCMILIQQLYAYSIQRIHHTAHTTIPLPPAPHTERSRRSNGRRVPQRVCGATPCTSGGVHASRWSRDCMFVLHTWRCVRDLCWPPALQVTWQAGGRVGRAGRVGGRQRRVLLYDGLQA